MGRGIDYGMGTTNIDKTNGIRFGIIHRNADRLTEWVDERFGPDYGEPTCGKCGNEMVDFDSDVHDEYKRNPGCSDYACEQCEEVFDSSESFPDEAIGYQMTEAGYVGHMDGDGDIWVIKSPYYTRASYCSPCAPGACHLENPHPDGDRAYCLGKDWFQDEKAPYPIWRVDNDELIYTPEPEAESEE